MDIIKGLSVKKQSIQDLYNMLMMMRPAFSDMDDRFIDDYLVPLKVQEDKFGNIYKRIGKEPVMWSCHTDTVHRYSGYQGIRKNEKNIISLHSNSVSNCLGADDTAGAWLMIEMIKAGKPGLYVFHRSEENGCVGSKYIVKNYPRLVDGIECCIALDRKANTSVITYQSGSRCCSNDFGNKIAELIDMNYRLDEWGSFTDSATYVDLIGECTNLSVGYTGQHGRTEDLDLAHLVMLREKLIAMDLTKLVYKRKPGEKEKRTYSGGHYYGRHYGHEYGYDNHYTPPDYDVYPLTYYYSGYYDGTKWHDCSREEWEEEKERRENNVKLRAEGKPIIPRKTPSTQTDSRMVSSIKEDTKAKPRSTAIPPQRYYRMKGTVPVEDTVLEIVKDYPDEIADMLEEWGFDVGMLREEVRDREKKLKGTSISQEAHEGVILS